MTVRLLCLCLLLALRCTALAQVVYSENFQSTTAGSLPSGWTSANTGLGNWRVQGVSQAKTVSTQTSGNNNGKSATLTSASFATVKGQTYLVSFLLVLSSRVSLTAGRTGGSATSISLAVPGTKTFTFTANAATSTISFTATATSNGNATLSWNNLVVTRVVPELDPAGVPLAWSFAGAVLLLVERRRR